MQYDLIVVGGGPGGYVAAIRAAQLGMKTALVEREHLGGICLNWGCIPTKALLRSSELLDQFNHASEYGLIAENIGFDLQKIIERSRGISDKLSKGIQHLLRKNKVDVIDGEASLKTRGELLVKKKSGAPQSFKAKHIVLATGARARQIPGLNIDSKYVWTYKEALKPDALPESLLVIGSGAIGIEFACFYASLGVAVTVVEALPKILPLVDEELSKIAVASLTKKGIKFYANATVDSVIVVNGKVEATIKGVKTAEKISIDRVLSAIGVVPNTEDLGLKQANVKLTEGGFVSVDKYCKTSVEGVYAIGDLAGGPCLAHKASHEAVICVEKIANIAEVEPLDKTKIPACIYSSPQIATIGLTEQEAIKNGYEVKVGRFPYAASGKAIALGEQEGLIKTIVDAKTGEVLGAHMVGCEVTEMVSTFSIASTLEATEADFSETIFSHPSLSEMLHESVLDALGRAVHI